ncbi:hypothetical protein [Promicromonospora kroppenstedtii]|uniref:hypothetical protein n=1 Tax=Promicromonospora kroppenstedtii TaxID=440482 RepID=UPI0004BA8671|nr:hypothetical protein [Promicromonospora kroppenstedtii]
MTSAVPGTTLRAGGTVVLGAARLTACTPSDADRVAPGTDLTSLEQSGRSRLGDLLAVR